jgi:hypothetical protein
MCIVIDKITSKLQMVEECDWKHDHNLSCKYKWPVELQIHVPRQSPRTSRLGGPRLKTLQSHWITRRVEGKKKTPAVINVCVLWRCMGLRPPRGHVRANGLKATFNVPATCLHRPALVSSLAPTVWASERMLAQMIGRMWSWRKSRSCSDICLEGLKKTTTNLSQDSRVPAEIRTQHLPIRI